MPCLRLAPPCASCLGPQQSTGCALLLLPNQNLACHNLAGPALPATPALQGKLSRSQPWCLSCKRLHGRFDWRYIQLLLFAVVLASLQHLKKFLEQTGHLHLGSVAMLKCTMTCLHCLGQHLKCDPKMDEWMNNHQVGGFILLHPVLQQAMA